MTRAHTSYSEIKLARRCEKAWAYRYVERIQRKRPERPQLVGTIMHEMLHAYIQGKLGLEGPDPWDVLEGHAKKWRELWEAEKEMYGDIPGTVTAIFEGYLRRWKGDGLIYEGSEVEIECELLPGVPLYARIDKVVVRTKDGLRFLMDHKFHKTIPDPQDRFADLQTLLYFWAWNRVKPKKERADGVLWDYGRMKAPAIPEVLKSGELSKRANIDTDAYTYAKAVRDHGLNPADYREFIASLAGKERTFFERVPLPGPPKAMIAQVVEDAKNTLLIRRQFGAAVAPRHMSGFNCNRCDYRALCEAEVRGLDAAFIRKRDYKPREEHKEYSFEDVA